MANKKMYTITYQDGEQSYEMFGSKAIAMELACDGDIISELTMVPLGVLTTKMTRTLVKVKK